MQYQKPALSLTNQAQQLASALIACLWSAFLWPIWGVATKLALHEQM